MHLDCTSLGCETHAHVHIADNDPLPSVAIGDAAMVAEGNVGTKTATFTLTLSEPSGRPVTVSYATSDEPALAKIFSKRAGRWSSRRARQ